MYEQSHKKTQICIRAPMFVRRPYILLIVLILGSSIVSAADNLPEEHEIKDISWVAQSWNNCGPATLSMALDRWEIAATQEDIASLIRPSRNDGHVSMDQIRTAAASYGMESLYIPAGDLALVKSFVSAGFPVMMPTWHIDSPRNQMGHYRLVHGYNDTSNQFFLRDSLEPIGYRMDYREFDVLWRVFNRRMLVLYPPERAGEAAAISSGSGSATDILTASLVRAANETQAPDGLPDGISAAQYSAYTDYNRAMAFTALGRHEKSAEALYSAFSKGLPWRMLWYQPEVLESVYRVGDYDWIIQRTRAALNPYPYLEELWYWRGRAESALGHTNEAKEAYNRALEIQPGWARGV